MMDRVSVIERVVLDHTQAGIVPPVTEYRAQTLASSQKTLIVSYSFLSHL